MSAAVDFAPCSCGVPNCPELGWPHEWDPIVAGDSCSAAVPRAIFTCTVEQAIAGWVPPTHKVTAPYVRNGSGYACEGCVALFAGEKGGDR